MHKKTNFSFESLFLSLRGKVILTFIVSGLAVYVAWLLTDTLFSKTRKTVENLSAPNERLLLIDSLYYSFNEINRLQYSDNTQNSVKANDRMAVVVNKTTAQLQALSEMGGENQLQLQRIDTLIDLVVEHKKLYGKYIRLKSEILRNSSLDKNIKELEALLLLSKGMIDSNVVTTTQKTTTITEPVIETKEKSSIAQLFGRIFGKRNEEAQLKKTVIEEKHISIDTLTVGQRDSLQQVILNYINEMSLTQLKKNNRFIAKEKELMISGNKLIRQMYHIISAIKQDEALTASVETAQTANTLKSGLTKLNILLVVFLLALGVLVLLILFDLSKSNQYRLALQDAKQEAEELALAKQRFLANMSHELRTPLQSIIGFAEQGKEDAQPKPELLNTIYNASEHLLQVVNDVLDYSKISSGKITLNENVFSLNEVLLNVQRVFTETATEKGLTFIVNNNQTSDLKLKGDDFRLKQILYNLLGNALKFTGEGSITLNIKTENREEKVWICFEVCDTGIGMTEEQQAKIFNEFEQADERVASVYGGSGLGLTIVQQLVQQMNGKVEVYSVLKQGSTFSVRIPFEEAEELTNEIRQPAFISNPQQSIWLVDDDAFIRQLCFSIFQKHQLQNARVFTSAAALLAEPITKNTPIIFADIRMPDMSGFELCKIIKQRNAEIKMIAITAQAMPYEQDEILRKGFDAVLTKPFLEKDLLNIINRFSGKNEIAFDMNNIRKMSGDDEALFKQNIEAMLMETEQDLILLYQSVAENNPKSVYETAHKLAGRIGMFGAKKLHTELRKLEQELLSSDFKAAYKNRAEMLAVQVKTLMMQIRNSA